MAKKAEEQTTALAPVDSTAAALAAALEDFDFEVDATGLEEADASDIRFASKIWNMTSELPGAGRHLSRDEFFDTLSETASKSLRCVFVSLHKTHDFSFFDNDKNETIRVCSSPDRVTGKLRTKHPTLPLVEGTVRDCDGCPDADWTKDDKGKNKKNCAEVYGVFCLELGEQNEIGSPFMIRFKKTGLAPFKAHIQKHHLGRMKTKAGKITDVPLFVFPVEITLKLDKGGRFAVPVITRGDVLPPALVAELAAQAKAFVEMSHDVTEAVDRRESTFSSDDAIDTEGSSTLRNSDFTG